MSSTCDFRTVTILTLVFALLPAMTLAGQTAQTTPQTFVSSLGRFRLTIFPLEDPQASLGTHFEYMVKSPPSIQSASQTRCEATLERWVGNSYELVWRKSLVK